MVAAAGRGERAYVESSDVPKQFRTVAGRPLLAWAAAALADAGCTPLVVVLPRGLLVHARDFLEGVDALVVPGGATRQESVALGLQRIDSELVVIHDGARPLATPALVQRVVAAARAADGAICALPVDETVKRVEDGRVMHTEVRAGLWSVQTPQAFHTRMLRAAHDAARRKDFVGTDDAQLVERLGGNVVVVRGHRANIKVTYSEDFALAEALIAAARS